MCTVLAQTDVPRHSDQHFQEILEHMALQLEAVHDVAKQGEGGWTGGFEEKQTSEWNRFAHALMDEDIASVLNGLALCLWNTATTFAIGTPPEQLVQSSHHARAPGVSRVCCPHANQVSPRQFCAVMDAVGMPVWSVHRALDRVFENKRRCCM